MRSNKLLTLSPDPVLDQATLEGIAYETELRGQEAGDRMRFDAVNKLTGLADYIKSYDYNADGTFTVNFNPRVEEFLAHSPYFSGPGIALLHLSVGTFDYRSVKDLTGGLSLQVVVGRGKGIKESYADFDKYNPYQDLVSTIQHNVPIILRRIGRLFHS